MKVIKTDVLILVEHKVRELESACLLKYEFERKGYSVEIVSLFPNKEKIPLKYSAEIIFLPWAYNNRSMRFISCFLKYSPHVRFVNLHHEQYTTQDSDWCIPKDEAKKVYHIAWGKQFQKELLESGCDPKRIFTPGSIRLDFFKGDLKKRFWSREKLSEKFGIDGNKKWVLYIGDGQHLLEEYQIKQSQLGDKNFAEKHATCIQCRNDFLEYADRYLGTCPDTVFIYRPHPSFANKDKKQPDLKQMEKKYPDNFFVISDLAINNWLVNADICISYQSTSFVECYFSKAPYYLFRTKDLRKGIDMEMLENYRFRITSYKDFEKALELKEYDDKALGEILRDYYILDDQYCYEKIADYVLGCEETKDVRLSQKIWMYNCIRAGVKEVIQGLSGLYFIKELLLKIGDNRVFRIVDNKEDAFSGYDIYKIVESIKKCLE